MSDPYKEVTRGQGLSPLAWTLIVIGGFFVMGFVGLVGVGLFVAKKAADVVEDFRDNPVAAFSEMAEFFDDDVRVVARDEAAGTVTLEVEDSGEQVTVDLSELGEALNRRRGDVRFGGEADESGGVLRIHTDEGETRIELRGGEDGGFLRISTPEEEVRFGAGADAAALPDWVPVYPGARVHERLFSAETDDGSFGGALLRTNAAPADVLEWYQEELPRQGFTREASSVVVDDGEVRGKIEWASDDDDRKISVVVGEDDDGEGFVLILHRVED